MTQHLCKNVRSKLLKTFKTPPGSNEILFNVRFFFCVCFDCFFKFIL